MDSAFGFRSFLLPLLTIQKFCRCLTEVGLLVHGQYLHGSKSFLQYWGSPLCLRTVLTIPSCFFFHKQYSAEANIILTGSTVLCLREAVLFVCGQCLRIQISEDVFLIWEEFLWTQKVSTLQRPTTLFEYTAYMPNSYVQLRPLWKVRTGPKIHVPHRSHPPRPHIVPTCTKDMCLIEAVFLVERVLTGLRVLHYAEAIFIIRGQSLRVQKLCALQRPTSSAYNTYGSKRPVSLWTSQHK